MKRYYSKEHNRLMLSPKMTEPHPLDTEDCLRTEIDFKKFASLKEAYNTWLSSSLEIIGEHNWKDGQEVVEGVDYEVEERWNPIQQSGSGIIYQPGFYAIPKKEKEDYVPNVQSNNEASVASHSSGFSNSVGHRKNHQSSWRDPNDLGGTGHGDISYSDADPGL